MTTGKTNNYSFQKGYGLIANKDARKVREEIMRELNITSRTSWYDRLKGHVIPNVQEKEAIEEIFRKYNVKADQVWG